MSTTELTLKWGTLKAWEIEDAGSKELLERYYGGGVSRSAALQRDSPEQKQILCDLIRHHQGTIYLDWDNKYVTQDEAIKYVMEYET